MKIFLFSPILAFVGVSTQSTIHFAKQINTDTSSIQHVQDGAVSEWPDSSFQTDKETTINYAADNDGKNLYVAMKISSFPMQMKMMRQGMSLFIDLKGKKKEGRGAEFPVKRENDGSFSGGGSGNQQGGFDKKAMRSRYAIFLLTMKLFGFSDGDPVTQELGKPGSVNINYSWDDKDVMYLEYLIPLNMLGDPASLNNKTISLGWKINGVDMPSNATPPTIGTTTTSTRRVVSFPSGSGQGPNQGNVYPGGGNQADMEKMMQEQSFWTKYTFH